MDILDWTAAVFALTVAKVCVLKLMVLVMFVKMDIMGKDVNFTVL